MEKVKLMISYGGKIHHRPHDRKLSYVGGDTKILTIDRNISFSNLISKLNAICESNSEIRFKYKLPGHDLDALVSVFDDEDVENMLFEYDLLRRISAAPIRLRLFVFSPATATASTPVTARSINPDFLFGFDKEYSGDVSNATPAVNDGLIDVGNVTPVMIQEIEVPVTVTRGSYVAPAPVMYQTSSGYLQAGTHIRGGNREQPVVYGYMAGGNREQAVVYGYIPVMPSISQEMPNVPVNGGALSYDGTRGELQFSTGMMTATSNHESKFVPGTHNDG